VSPGEIHDSPEADAPPSQGSELHKPACADQRISNARDKVGENLKEYSRGTTYIQKDEGSPQGTDPA